MMVQSKKTIKDKLGTPEEAEKRAKTKAKDGLKQTKINFKKKDSNDGNYTNSKRT